MATFDISPLFRSTSAGYDRVGLDRNWSPLSTAMYPDSSGFPAYDILRLTEDEFRITLAVPGFAEADLCIETREGSVWVKGDREVDPNHNTYLHRGIGTQGFQRTFQLPEHVKVAGARLEAGLLHIDLVRELPESLRPRRIEISSAATAKPMLEDATRAA